MEKETELLDKYLSLVGQTSSYSSRRDLPLYLDYLFEDVSFDNKAMLDVGGGAGLFSFYAACMGANKVICLEPELAGASREAIDEFKKLRSALPTLDQVKLKSTTIQNFDSNDDKFDIILLHDSINHLDEEACINLRHDCHAMQAYKAIFEKLRGLASSGAQLIITDCSRYNFFALCNLRNPFAPNITWSKHQSARYWARLLSDAGFCNPKIRWTAFRRLPRIGRLPLVAECASYFLRSHFCLTMQREQLW